MLLNNDYYLDAKTQILSRELNTAVQNVNTLKNVLEKHINDDSMHYQNNITIKNEYNEPINIVNNTTIEIGGSSATSIYNGERLKRNTIKYLSIGWTPETIQNVIDSTPHDLNGFNLMFLFVVPEEYKDRPVSEVNDAEIISTATYSIDLVDECIKFNNFINGTLIVAGDWLHESKINGVVNMKKSTKKTADQIDDPETHDGLVIDNYLLKFKKEVENPERIAQIVKYEDDDPTASNLNKIKIMGRGFNEDYSIMSFDQNRAKVIVKNLSFENTLTHELEDPNTVNLSQLSVKTSSPFAEQLISYWPLEKDLLPIYNGDLEGEIVDGRMKDKFKYLSMLEKYVAYELTGGYNYEELSSAIHKDLSSVIDVDEYYPSTIDPSRNVSGIISDFSFLSANVLDPSTKDNIMIELSGSGFTDLDAKNFLISLTNEIDEVIATSNNLIASGALPVPNKYDEDDLYYDPVDGRKNALDFYGKTAQWANLIQIAYSSAEKLFTSTNFNRFLKIRPDVVNDFLERRCHDRQ